MSKHVDTPLALSQVWDWKTAVWDDLKGTSFVDAAAIVADRAREATRNFGFQTVASPAKRLCAAESGATYVTKQDSNKTR